MEYGKDESLEQDIEGLDCCGYCRTGCIGRHERAEMIPYGIDKKKGAVRKSRIAPFTVIYFKPSFFLISLGSVSLCTTMFIVL